MVISLSKPVHRILLTLFTLVCLLIPSRPISAQIDSLTLTPPMAPPVFENDSSNFTNSGSIKLSWRSSDTQNEPSQTEFELQRATISDLSTAKTYYRGPDLATYISGLADGHYYFRVRQLRGGLPQSDWSSTVEVVVEHHSLNLAFTLFGIGAVVFILTLLVVIRGAARTSEPDERADTSSAKAGG